MRCCIVGVGKHSTDNLIPGLLKLQEKKLIIITHICREHPEKGDNGLNVKVIKDYTQEAENFDFMVVCGHPTMHLDAINFSNKNNIPCFVEKPHLIEDIYVNHRIMIGYNFNFIPILQEIETIDSIVCGTKGIYKSWPDLFQNLKEKYYHAFHSVIIHPISVMVQRYGAPGSVSVTNLSKNDEVELIISLNYQDQTRSINFSSNFDQFNFDIISGGKIIKCKPFKPASYYNMLEYYVLSGLNPAINNAETGKNVLNVVKSCLEQL
jgi:hypothetical protein